MNEFAFNIFRTHLIEATNVTTESNEINESLSNTPQEINISSSNYHEDDIKTFVSCDLFSVYCICVVTGTWEIASACLISYSNSTIIV